MELLFHFADIFAIIWAFAYATNGSKRMILAKIGIFGVAGTILASIASSIINRDLFFVGVIIEIIIVLLIATLIFNFIFKNVTKRN